MKKVLSLVVLSLAMFAISCGPNAEELEAKRIADSIKLADSIAKIEFVTDSIAEADSITKADSIAAIVETPVKK